ncbi:hypothetical protein [Salmonella enterica]|uniref:hypothetical protein n=1 Tax=Salmonella enterica TaxID=28901 RepID=UPI000BE76AAC|nr:hypothetical protein [Salmonella enterica]PDQ08583.1 hypothetical protein CJZ73_21045 [Salmonella enterica subsp. enterica serovar Enteritidis]
MASALTAFPEDGDFGRIWYDRLCIEFNSDGGLSPAELRVITDLNRVHSLEEDGPICGPEAG